MDRGSDGAVGQQPDTSHRQKDPGHPRKDSGRRRQDAGRQRQDAVEHHQDIVSHGVESLESDIHQVDADVYDGGRKVAALGMSHAETNTTLPFPDTPRSNTSEHELLATELRTIVRREMRKVVEVSHNTCFFISIITLTTIQLIKSIK